MSNPSRKLLLAIHVICTGSWLGATCAIAFLSAIGMLTEYMDLRRSAYRIMNLMDVRLIVPLVMSAILTGVVLALRTPWGLFRHRWVVAKLAIALAMVAFVVGKVMSWVKSLAEETASGVAGPVSGYLMAGALIFVVALWSAMLLAVYKPWGKT